MISLQELLQQLDLQPSAEETTSLEVGIHLSSVQGTPNAPDLASRDVGWHIDRLTASLAHAGADVFFDDFGRHCGRLVLASLDEAAEQQFLEGGLPSAEMLAKPLGPEAWIVEGAFWYGALRNGRRILKQVLCARGIETVGYIVYRAAAVAKVWEVDCQRSLELPVRPAAASPLRAGQLRHEARSWLAERQAIGAALRVLSSSDRFRALSLDDAMCLVLGPITLGQYELGCTETGKPISFRSWAYLTEHATTRLATEGPRSLSDGCWNQGTQKTLVCDWSTAPPGNPDWAWVVLPTSRYSIVAGSALPFGSAAGQPLDGEST